MKRTWTSAELGHITRLNELVDEAARHHHDATVAHDAGDDRGVAAAHLRLGRCLRSGQLVFKRIAEGAAQANSDATKTIQTSDGIGVSGGTANGRAGSPQRVTPGLMTGDVKTWLERARVGGRR